jgi:uncharacterized membrane protein YjjP (DUF1212 family)
MDSPASSKQSKRPWMFGKIALPGVRRHRTDPVEPIHAKTDESSLAPGRTFSDLEDGEQPPKRRPRLFSFMPARSREVPVLDDELFEGAKTSQSQPKWPSYFDVPDDISSPDKAALRPSPSGEILNRLADSQGKSFYQGGKRPPSVMKRNKRQAVITKHVQGTYHDLARAKLMSLNADIDKRRKFVLKLAKCLISFGAPSHRIESQLSTASKILDAKAAFVHIPDLVIVTFGDEDVASVETHFVKAKGRIALGSLHQVHLIYRKVLHDQMTVEDGTKGLKGILNARPLYSLGLRCLFAFVSASAICALVFGGSIIDMWVSGFCACVLQYLGLNAASKSAMYANVYE